MGLFSRQLRIAELGDSSLLNTRHGIVSPWATQELIALDVGDMLGLFPDSTQWITREQAMSIPGVYRARAILLSLIADKPLKALRLAEPINPQPSFLYRTPPGSILGPWQRMAMTLDDLIFYPYSLWLTERGADRNGRKDILNATHCPWDRWQVNSFGQIEVLDEDSQWVVQTTEQVILIPGPSEGLIAYASRTLFGAAELERSWVDRASFPAPLTELHLTDDTQLTDEETLATRDMYAAARRITGGSVTVTPSNIEVIDHGQADPAMFIEGRNAGRLDIAAFFNLPGAILDATTAQASLTYVTQEGTKTSVYDLSLPYWTRPIEDRLSQDDVVPAGQSVKFDFSTLAPTQPAPTTED